MHVAEAAVELLAVIDHVVDFVGSRAACIHDAQATIVQGNSAILYLWYDNEFGYSCQVVRMVQKMAGIELPSLP